MKRQRLNIEILSYLVGTFNQITKTFGENSKSVQFFRNQVENLVGIGQIGSNEANFVFRLIGMVNTDAVKWEITNKRLAMFIECMNYTVGSSNTEIIRTLAELQQNNTITKEVKELIEEVFGIEAYTPVKRNNAFGELNNKAPKVSKQPDIDSSSNVINSSDKIQNILNIFNKYANKNVYIEVVNLDAVCSGDPSSFRYKIEDFVNYGNTKGYDYYAYMAKIANYIVDGAKFKIGEIQDDGDICRPRSVIVKNEHIHRLLNKNDFASLALNVVNRAYGNRY